MSEVETAPKSRLSVGRIINIAVVVVVVGWIIWRIISPYEPTVFSGVQPDNLGIDTTGQLTACPSTPNCVNSQSQDPEHYIEPFALPQDSDAAWENLVSIVENFEGSQIIANTGDYLYAEFNTKLMGFVDDVEFVKDEVNQRLDVRSASRLGESDLDTNRKRIEMIRAQFDKVAQS
ncbi:MAG: DUF1499 domain-containing protein [Spirulinaceae cyanobacterium]